MTTPLWSEFEAIDKQTWLDKITKDLKGKALSELQWQLGDMSIDPFSVRADGYAASPMLGGGLNNDWDINEIISTEDAKIANKQALEALMGGANAITFDCGAARLDMEVLLQDIECQYISTHFVNVNDVSRVMQQFETALGKRGQSVHDLQGSISTTSELEADEWAGIIRWASKYMPKFKVINITDNGNVNPEDATDYLYNLVHQANEWMGILAENEDISPSEFNQVLQFNMAIGKSYFVEMAKIRALKLLWANVLDAWKVPIRALPPIVVYNHQSTISPDVNRNMIMATTLAMSAATAGVSRLTISLQSPMMNAFERRMARNIQHILKMESYVEQVMDVAAGSYYIEQLSQQMAASVWAKLGK